MSAQNSLSTDRTYVCNYSGCGQTFTVLFDWTRHVRKHASMRHSSTTSESQQVSGVTQIQQGRSLAQGKPIVATQSPFQQNTPSTPATTFASRYLSTSNIPFTLGSLARTNTSTTDKTNTSTADKINTSTADKINTSTTDNKRNSSSNSKLAWDDKTTKTDKFKKFKASSKYEGLLMKPMSTISLASSVSVSMEQRESGTQSLSQSARLTTESTASSHKTTSSPHPSSLAEETSKLVQICKPPRLTSRLLKNKKPEILKSSTAPTKSADIKDFFAGTPTPTGKTPSATLSIQSTALCESGASSESTLSSSQTPASSPTATSLTPVYSAESLSASDVEADNYVDAAETSEAAADKEAKVDLGCELRFTTFNKPGNNVRGKSRSKEASSLTHSCETIFESEDAQIKHYLEHIIAQGPHLQCPVKDCRMVFLSDNEMTEHSLKSHPSTSPIPPLQPTQKSQQQSKHKRTRLQSKGGKAINSTPVISTIVVATTNPVTKPKPESKPITTSSHKRKPLKASRSLRSESNSSQKSEDLFYEDAPPIVLGRLFTR